MNAMKKIGYTTLLGMLLMGMTGMTAWSQVTITITETTPTSVTFHFGRGTTAALYIVERSGIPVMPLAPRMRVNRMADSDVSATVEDLTSATTYTIYYGEAGVAMTVEQDFTTLVHTLETLTALVESQAHTHADLTTLEAETPHTHTDLTTLEAETPHTHTDLATLESQSHPHANLTTLESQSHPHANLTTLESQSHPHADLATLESQSHPHANLTTLESQSHPHADLATLESQSHIHANQAALDAHSHADLAASDHAHDDPTAPTLITSYRSATSRLVFIPNPAHDTFTIQGIESYDRIEVYDIQGRVVHTQQDGLSIDLARHPRGVYHVKVHTRNAVHEQRIIKE